MKISALFISIALTFGVLNSFAQTLEFQKVGPPAGEPQNVYDFEGAATSFTTFIDIEGDGDLDLIASVGLDNSSWEARLFVNDGLGNFIQSEDFSWWGLQSGAYYNVDIDGDGDEDVVQYGVFNAPGFGSIIIHVNDGMGNFSDFIYYFNTSGYLSQSQPLLFSDLDGDSDIDFLGITDELIDGEFQYVTTIYFNEGENNFEEDTAANLGPGVIDSGRFFDIDGDTDLDLVAFGNIVYPSSVPFSRIYENNGDGVFQIIEENTLPVSSVFNDVADVDNDGDLDFIINASHLYKNDGTGNFTQQQLYEDTGLELVSVKFIDFDGNGTMDLLISGNNSGEAFTGILQNDGAGNFSNLITISNEILLTSNETINSSVDIIDVDNDGDLDFMSKRPLSLYINAGGGQFQRATNTAIEGNIRATRDIDGDGDLDVLSSGLISGNSVFSYEYALYLYRNLGANQFVKEQNVPFGDNWNVNAVFSDIDGDGDNDLFLLGTDDANQPISNWYLNDGLGGFTLSSIIPFGSYSDLLPLFADIDGDGDEDVFFEGGILFINQGSGSFTQATAQPFEGLLGTFEVADFDDDDDQDLLIGINQPAAKFFANDGNGNFTELFETEFGSYGAYGIEDIDGDTDLDIVFLIGGVPNNLMIYRFDLTIGFAQESSIMLDDLYNGFIDMNIADLDNDGDNDLILSETLPYSLGDIYLNDGTGVFTLFANFKFPFSGNVYVNDLDGDCDMDVFCAGQESAWNQTRKAILFSNITPNSANTYYADVDGDGFGDPETMIQSCVQPRLFVQDASDCNDGDPDVNANMEEIPDNGVDDDCNPDTPDYSGCPDGKVLICHVTGNGNSISLCVSSKALQGHLNHGDYIGTCNDSNARMAESAKGDLQDIKVFPNPFSDEIYIQFSSQPQLRDVSISVLDVNGRMIVDQDFSGNQALVSLKLDNLKNGFYFIKVSDASNGINMVKTLVKQ
ncbi:T9SS type A sorting domain-containing protein [Mangrovimonas aestuarii]|uniref:T9SS type A sorting domain-containing protein n=1 Tax=Mangrovimonas aestuarii TaxID=3018443 RepID=UPI002379542E|nr:T9SS type A sorting domain-containing protein [Mangrovimonas aestuarii]